MKRPPVWFLTEEEIEICKKIKPLHKLNGIVWWGNWCAFFRKWKGINDLKNLI